jgi:hypothetical protein
VPESNVRLFPNADEVAPDAILELARGNLTTAVVVGIDHDGDLFVLSNTTNAPLVYWLLSRAARKCLPDERAFAIVEDAS